MSTEASSFDVERPRSFVRELAIPMVVAGLICCGFFFAAMKWLRPDPVPKQKSKWVITWVDLSSFQKPNAPAQKPKR